MLASIPRPTSGTPGVEEFCAASEAVFAASSIESTLLAPLLPLPLFLPPPPLPPPPPDIPEELMGGAGGERDTGCRGPATEGRSGTSPARSIEGHPRSLLMDVMLPASDRVSGTSPPRFNEGESKEASGRDVLKPGTDASPQTLATGASLDTSGACPNTAWPEHERKKRKRDQFKVT